MTGQAEAHQNTILDSQAEVMLMGFVDVSGKTQAVSAANPLPGSSSGGGSFTIPTPVTTTLSANGVFSSSIALGNCPTVVMVLSGTWSGSVAAVGSTTGSANLDGTYTPEMYKLGGSSIGDRITSTTSNGTYLIDGTGFTDFCAYTASYASGTINIKFYAYPSPLADVIRSGTFMGRARTAGDAGMLSLFERNDTPTGTVTESTGQYSVPRMSLKGFVYTQAMPAAQNGLSVKSIVSANSDNATNVKTTAGQLYGYQISNKAITPNYVKLYNKASTAPTVGTDTPFMRLMIPAGQTIQMQTDVGIAFSAGIGYGIVTGSADADDTSVAAGDVCLNLLYF